MKICRVLGTSVATVKEPVYDGKKVLVVAPVDLRYAITGPSFLAVDFAGAGSGETVLVAQEGNAARQLEGDPMAPIHSVVLGIVDQIDADGSVRLPPAGEVTA